MFSGLEVRQADLVGQVDRDLERLGGRVATQEQGFSELVGYLEDRRSLLVATPSMLPTQGWVTSGYRRRSDPSPGTWSGTAGWTSRRAIGIPVIAPADGVVTVVGRKADFGNIFALDHGYGYLSRYGHNSRVLVRAGQRVRRGEVVALVGNTGKSTGPHLHYEMLRDGVPVDPLDYILN